MYLFWLFLSQPCSSIIIILPWFHFNLISVWSEVGLPSCFTYVFYPCLNVHSESFICKALVWFPHCKPLWAAYESYKHKASLLVLIVIIIGIIVKLQTMCFFPSYLQSSCIRTQVWYLFPSKHAPWKLESYTKYNSVLCPFRCKFVLLRNIKASEK